MILCARSAGTGLVGTGVVGGAWWLVGGWWLVVGGWWVVVGGWWVVVGGWWLVVGGWWLVVGGWWVVGGGVVGTSVGRREMSNGTPRKTKGEA